MRSEKEITARLEWLNEHKEDDDADFRALETEEFILEWVLGERELDEEV